MHLHTHADLTAKNTRDNCGVIQVVARRGEDRRPTAIHAHLDFERLCWIFPIYWYRTYLHWRTQIQLHIFHRVFCRIIPGGPIWCRISVRHAAGRMACWRKSNCDLWPSCFVGNLSGCTCSITAKRSKLRDECAELCNMTLNLTRLLWRPQKENKTAGNCDFKTFWDV